MPFDISLPSDGPDDAKKLRALEGAMKAFFSYGYQRTSMDDIAKAAGMSRPALYLLFRNKADIFQEGAVRVFERSAMRLENVLNGPGSLSERLFQSIDQGMISIMAKVNASPHGSELIDMKHELSGGFMHDWHERSVGLFKEAIEAEAASTGVDLAARGLTAQVLAELLVDGLEGVKHRVSDIETQRTALRQLIRVIELALKK
ncbi:MAG: TetR/AcrR family transcriptional regulator [Rhizobiaceae bacterium]|nr:TetR/AcrR family transcriptional regulator [Rhizobiaceae bacterium]